ncbi:putative gag-polypeptide of LTR copia-type [Lupinus albus]|uniref:Putative gag-polypeptide of LTR copia-type n=1 Tax=Lupinus albus TaxID=3870 RepID=A0A6A4QVU1_LUPAL|nr:putative gag-polypeptide of LTR copia-type [Lupinus albus]
MDNHAITPINHGQDPTSPFFIHPSQNPHVTLVPVFMNGDNYHSRSRAMAMSLKTKNKLQFIDGYLPRPHIDDPRFANWERCNTLMVSWLIQLEKYWSYN